MRSYLLIVVGFVALASSVPATGLAQGEEVFVFLMVPADTQVLSGAGNDIGIVTGRPLGVMTAGACGGVGDNSPVQNVIIVHPGSGRSTFATVIVLETTHLPPSDPLPAGTQLTVFEPQGTCNLGPDEYDRYLARILR